MQHKEINCVTKAGGCDIEAVQGFTNNFGNMKGRNMR